MYHFRRKSKIVNILKCTLARQNQKVTKLLQQFILDEIRQRDMSAREFARYVGVSSATILRAISDDPPEPTLKFLSKLSTATGVDICTLVLMVTGGDPAPDLDAEVIAQRIETLSPELRELVKSFIFGVLLTNRDQSTDE